MYLLDQRSDERSEQARQAQAAGLTRPALEFAVRDDDVEAPPPSSAPAARVRLR